MALPERHEPYTDKYFLRSKEVLAQEGLNPYVRAQVFLRQGPGTIQGIDEAVEIIDRFSPLRTNGGRVLALSEGSRYSPLESVIIIEGRVQDIITLETMYLGVITAETTKANDDIDINLDSVRRNMTAVVEVAKGREVSYFGARHWRFDRDAEIAKAAFEGGASSTSTDIGAAQFGQKGVGTIPHILENVYAWKYGYDKAVVEATKAFDRVMDRGIPRIALIDYANREIDDALSTAESLSGKLYAVRVDTCGENVPQGGKVKNGAGDPPYWYGNGVTISGVSALRRALDDFGHDYVKIILSSGFGNVEKVKAFAKVEKELGLKLFDGLGVGGVYPARMATMDVVAVGEDKDYLQPMAKVGRTYRPNPRLEVRL